MTLRAVKPGVAANQQPSLTDSAVSRADREYLSESWIFLLHSYLVCFYLLLIFHSLNMFVIIRWNSPFHAQPPTMNQISQLRCPSQIHALRPRAHGHNQRQGAEPYNTWATTLRA
jgi:hypothetical protein